MVNQLASLGSRLTFGMLTTGAVLEANLSTAYLMSCYLVGSNLHINRIYWPMVIRQTN